MEKHRSWILSSLLIVAVGAETSRAQENNPTSIEGWGNVINPDGDCLIQEQDGRVTITVPKGMHDFHYGNKDATKRYNSPRIMQKVEGDFVIQVKVTADWKLGESLPSGRNFIASGLLIWDSQNHYFRHERNSYMSPRQPGIVRSYIPPLYDRDRMRLTKWKGVRYEFFRDRSTWMRIERVGKTVTAFISHDGKDWIMTGREETDFSNTVQVGVLVINGSKRDFTSEFEGFQIESR